MPKMYFKGRGYKEGSRPGEASGQLRSAPGPPDKRIEEKMRKSNRKQRTMELVRISPPPGNSRATPGISRNSFQTGPKRLPDSSQKFSRKAHRQLQNDSQRAAGRLPERSGKTLGQFSGSPVFLYFAILFPFFLIFSITVSARISPKSSGLAR